MKEIGIEELKSLQVDILKKIHSFCEEKNLRYFIAYGSLIGAIRHKGYIPWDDDIDIVMPRKDYDLFINSFNGNVDNLHVLCPENTPSYYTPYANVCDKRTILDEFHLTHFGIDVGVKIDVFPLDNVPEDSCQYKHLIDKMRRLNSIILTKREKLYDLDSLWDKVKHCIKILLYSPFSIAKVNKLIIEIVK